MSKEDLKNYISNKLDNHFSNANGDRTSNLLKMIHFDIESEIIASTLRHTKLNKSKTASILGISRTTLNKKINLYKII